MNNRKNDADKRGCVQICSAHVSVSRYITNKATVIVRTDAYHVMNQLHVVALNEGLRRKRALWRFWRHCSNLMPARNCLTACASIESPHESRLSSRVGTRRSVHVTALGKAW